MNRAVVYLVILLTQTFASSAQQLEFQPVVPFSRFEQEGVFANTNLSMANDGHGNWIAVTEGLSGDFDIYYTVSQDNGDTWSDARPLNSFAAGDTASDREPHIATDKKGRWIVVWQTNYALPATIQEDRDIFYSTSDDLGETWSQAAPINLQFSTSDGANDDVLPQIVTNGQGQWLVAFESDSIKVAVTRSADNGTNWSFPTTPYGSSFFDTRENIDLDIAADNTGNAIVVFRSAARIGQTQTSVPDVYSVATGDLGITWSQPVPINSYHTLPDELKGSSDNPKIATDGAGNWAVVWNTDHTFNDTVGVDRDIAYSHSSNFGGTWSGAVTINPAATTDNNPDDSAIITLENDGAWGVMWSYPESVGGTGGLTPTPRIITSIDQGASWSDEQYFLSSQSPEPVSGNYNHLASDGSGTWLAIWANDLFSAASRDTDWVISRSTNSAREPVWSRISAY